MQNSTSSNATNIINATNTAQSVDLIIESSAQSGIKSHIKSNTESKPIIHIEHIYKYYGELVALENISFEVKPHCIFGIIGADGAGKSTLFRILSTLMLPDSVDSIPRAKHGKNAAPRTHAAQHAKSTNATQHTQDTHAKGSIAGFDLVQEYRQIRQIIGYMPAVFSLYADLSVKENLTFFADIFQVSIEENYALIKPIFSALEPFLDRRAGALSGGMKQKLALCCALIHKPKILFLDEPTTGVDMVSRAEFWEILGELKKQMTILVSTPYMDEANLCDEIALLANGKILSIDTPQNICASYPHRLFKLSGIDEHLLFTTLEGLRSMEGVHSCFLFAKDFHIVFKTANIAQQLDSLKRKYAANKGVSITEIKPSIEDCFIEFLR
ncbi:ABC transporter ATP-binding protein [Helicobacter jaachi]|uniref:ABC transporter ATP-binding protein n=1 Tax=Helicobacter jaachi TaxID=1677920 RepID=A0A4U8TAV0_9HELI|nr:ABC transporter ATP-binding protein [Helicobacter jaachi]TLD96804.1 ABC transporter ATP-binding protein [Helicobacter jaachi]